VNLERTGPKRVGESEAAIVSMNGARTAGRKGPLLPSEEQGKVAELPLRGKAISRLRREERLDNTRKLQHTLYRSAKSQKAKLYQMVGKVSHLKALDEC
jgi:hypothetical protein